MAKSKAAKTPEKKPVVRSTLKAKIIKALTPQSEWEKKGDILDALFWIRIVLGLVMGIVWGAIPLKGWIGFLLFIAINLMAAFGYVNYYQGFYDYEDSNEISQEGLMASLGLFLGTWIVTYTSLHF